MQRLLLATAITVGLGACAGQASYSASAHVTAPELVYIGPDVQVVADYHEPVFYTDSYYWRYDGGVWYRSNNHLRGWARVNVNVLPARIRRIERPATYVRYRGDARARGQGGVEVRDHRTTTPPPRRPAVQPAPQPYPVRGVRPDPKADRKDERADHKDQRKDLHDAHKAERKDLREDHKAEREDTRNAPKDVRGHVKADHKAERKDLEKDHKAARKDQRADQKDKRKGR